MQQQTTPPEVEAVLQRHSKLSTAITRLQPQARGRDEDTPGTTKSPRNLSVNREVFVKNFTGKPSWIQGTIIRRLGSRSWIIRTDQGTVRRHEDHIRNPNHLRQRRPVMAHKVYQRSGPFRRLRNRHQQNSNVPQRLKQKCSPIPTWFHQTVPLDLNVKGDLLKDMATASRGGRSDEDRHCPERAIPERALWNCELPMAQARH
ncbi:hypothetical protein HPB47_014724 [Ixodes persulcatus]|uniref:Uncharacterized protein n=1 Tax=Ixodes persulcatus TaxID=34615 RepID=A0AC60QYV2_IXOPE|nr:hypothetical protein HPB47_014724 [Ixodes persulcatus]